MIDSKLLSWDSDIVMFISTFVYNSAINFTCNIKCWVHIRYFIPSCCCCNNWPCLFLSNIGNSFPQLDLHSRARQNPIISPIQGTSLRRIALKLINRILRRQIILEDRAIHRKYHKIIQRLLRQFQEPDAEKVIREQNFIKNADFHQRFRLNRLKKLSCCTNLHQALVCMEELFVAFD